MVRWNTAVLFIVLCAQPGFAATASAPSEDLRARYQKREFMIPVRDGVHLYTAVYVPVDKTHTWPILMTRTPYGVGLAGPDQYRKTLGPAREFEQAGYIFVYQDVRGCHASEGEWREMTPHIDRKESNRDVDESSDTYDTIEYLLKNVPENNGRVGLWGVSYGGFYTSAGMIDSHPALRAASPQAPVTDLFRGDDAYHNGAFKLAANFGFYVSFRPRPAAPPAGKPRFRPAMADAYDFFLRVGPTAELERSVLPEPNPLFHSQLVHTTYDDYWKARDISAHLHHVTCAVLVVGGWFDAEDLAGPFRTYDALQRDNQGPVSLAVGPWSHGAWSGGDGQRLGDVDFGAKTAEYFRREIEFPFFEFHLKGRGAPPAPLVMFETGTNVWRQQDRWPPLATTRRELFLRRDGKLSFDAPAADEGHDEYVSDPLHPVPFTSYITSSIPTRYMVDDQRFAAQRPDVLVYQTEPLGDDVTVVGPVTPRLFVSTTGSDSDFVVKLIDVYPPDTPDLPAAPGPRTTPPVRLGGYQQLIRGEPFRAKFRNSLEKPEPMVAARVERIEFPMPDVNHTFKRGHRIMVQIQSSWFPLVDRNPQTFVDIPAAKPTDFAKATETVFHSRGTASAVEVNVLARR